MVRDFRPVQVIGQSFKGVKKCVVPMQSLPLREIIKRFVRRESLPVSKVGVYEERFGDLEKLAKADIVEQMEKVSELKAQISVFQLREKKRADKAKADALAASTPVVGVTPAGGTLVKSPPVGA